MERINGSEWVWNIVNTYDSEVRNISDRFSFASKTEVEDLLKSLYREKDRLNSNENQIQIDYACGWAFPDEDGAYTMQMLLDKADVYMYENKQLCKKRKI